MMGEPSIRSFRSGSTTESFVGSPHSHTSLAYSHGTRSTQATSDDQSLRPSAHPVFSNTPPSPKRSTASVEYSGTLVRPRPTPFKRSDPRSGSQRSLLSIEETMYSKSTLDGGGDDGDANSSLDVDSVEVVELIELGKKYDWFSVAQSKNERIPQRYHPLEPEDAPYFASYNHSSSNWDELTTSDYFIHPDSPSLRTSNIPQRVLDIGCSISATWIIKLALSRGWETTEFVGLDLAPVLAPLAYLPNEVSSRISFVQRNFLKGLPFLGGSFDYVRISNVGEGVPEDKWVDLLEEAILLLSKDGTLEIIEHDFAIYRAPNRHEAISDAFHLDGGILDSRFLNAYPTKIIPPALALLNCRNIRRTAISIPLRASLLSVASPPPSTTVLSLEKEDEDSAARVILHAYAERMASTSKLIEFEEASRLSLFADPTSAIPPRSRKALEGDIEALMHDWTKELKDRAQISSLLNGLGWHCEMDRRLEHDLLQVVVPGLSDRIAEQEEKLIELAALRREGEILSGDEGEEVEEEIMRGRFRAAKREAEVELREVRKRVQGKHFTELGMLGKFASSSWVCNPH